MADYNRTVWKDHIKDQNGNVIQQGIPVSAKNLNNIENQLVILSAKENTLAELIRETIPSGFTTLSDLDYSYMATNPNTIKLSSDSVAFVNGYKVVIPAGTVIQLDAPPTSGSRDDLVFLECWKQQDANGSVSWNYRIRVVDGVDFNTYSEGFHKYGQTWSSTEVTPQGNNSTPIIVSNGVQDLFSVYNYCDASNPNGRNFATIDKGLYFAGDGSTNSKTRLGAADGYAYAIPMFRVHRRNSGGYSVANGNGSILQGFYGVNRNSQNISDTVIACNGVTGAASVTGLNVGDKVRFVFYNNSTTYFIRTITAVDIANKTITLDGGIPYAITAGTYYIMRETLRADKLYADIIVDRDIMDLRHQVSLTGFNYQQLLEENFDKLLRGELQTNFKTIMFKTYHGIPKTPIDANTIFYASLDGSTIAEVGGTLSLGSGSFKPTPTGLGYKFNGDSATPLSVSGLSKDNGTMDMWINSNDLKNEIDGYPRIIYLVDANNNRSIGIAYSKPSNTLYGVENYNDTSTILTPSYIVTNNINYIHIRLSWDSSNLYFRVNGNLIGTIARKNSSYWFTPSKIFIGSNMSGNTFRSTLSDVTISNIDRGSAFATLPQDFIDGYARISQAFNEQRNVYSEALTSENEFVQVKCAGGNGKAIALGDVTDWAKDDGTKWNSGDRIKVKGLTGELITGVIDADTVLGSFNPLTTATSIIPVNSDFDFSKVSVGDTISIFSSSYTTYSRSITAIDPVNKTITINTTETWYGSSIYYIVETTASTSSPKVQYYNGATLVDITGTWSGLGTNEATFALGTNSSLTNQDLYITYGLNEVSGQGGISEVLTTILAGESNGKKLTVNPSVHVRDDFNGKVSGSVVVSPNISKVNTANTSLLAPNLITNECTDDQYNTIKNLDGNCSNSSVLASGQIPQQLFSFNIIRILEDKFGTLPCPPDISSKVAWLKANLSKVTINWWGYGTCPVGTGYAGYLDLYSSYVNNWYAKNAGRPDWCKTTKLTPSNLSQVIIATNGTPNRIENILQPDGFIHAIAYTDASDGVTPSTLYTDYVNIEIVLNSGTGYDVLAPENPRRDDGKSNILLVRKETKEIATMFPRSNNDKIITYGDYVPYQGNVNKLYSGISKILSVGKAFATSLGTGGVSKSGKPQIQNLPTTKRDYEFIPFAIYISSDGANLECMPIESIFKQIGVGINYSIYYKPIGKALALAYNTSDTRGYSNNYQSDSNVWGVTMKELLDNNKLVASCKVILPILVNLNGTLLLYVTVTDKTDRINNSGSTFDVMILNNRPLIK